MSETFIDIDIVDDEFTPEDELDFLETLSTLYEDDTELYIALGAYEI